MAGASLHNNERNDSDEQELVGAEILTGEDDGEVIEQGVVQPKPEADD